MGAWGYGIFDDDDAADVRDDWIEHYKFTASSSKATEAALKERGSQIDDEDIGPVIVVALALTLWKHGCMTDEWRDRALTVIDQGLGLDRWKEQGPKEVAKHQKHRDKARARLISPQPPSKEGKFKPKKMIDCGLRVGDIFSVPVSEGAQERGYFRVVALARAVGKIEPIVQLLSVPLDVDPAQVEWEKCDVIGVRCFRDGYCNRRDSHARIYDAWPKGFEKVIRIHRRGNTPDVEGVKPQDPFCHTDWKDVARYIRPSHDQSRWFDSEDFEKVVHTWNVHEVASKADWLRAECRKREWDFDQYLYRGIHVVISTYARYELGLALLNLVEPSERYTFRSYMRGWALLGLGRDSESQLEWQKCMMILKEFAAARERIEDDFAKARNIIESHCKAAEFYKSRPDPADPANGG